MNTQTFSHNTNFLSSLEVEHFGAFQKILPVSIPSPSIFLSQTCVGAAEGLAGHRLLVSAAVTHQKLPWTLLVQVPWMGSGRRFRIPGPLLTGTQRNISDYSAPPSGHMEQRLQNTFGSRLAPSPARVWLWCGSSYWPELANREKKTHRM